MDSGKNAVWALAGMSKSGCLADPSKPSSVFRSGLAKRRRQDREEIQRSLTPVLLAKFHEYIAGGKAPGEGQERVLKTQFSEALEKALDGTLVLRHGQDYPVPLLESRNTASSAQSNEIAYRRWRNI